MPDAARNAGAGHTRRLVFSISAFRIPKEPKTPVFRQPRRHCESIG